MSFDVTELSRAEVRTLRSQIVRLMRWVATLPHGTDGVALPSPTFALTQVGDF